MKTLIFNNITLRNHMKEGRAFINIKDIKDARYVLPNACHTKMNIVGNVQAWYDFLYGDAGRLQKAAQWEIRAIAIEIEKHLASIAPDIFKNEPV